ncbi:60S ribosomal protein L23a [Cricetulus griseus]|uniref:60S ribosomal protein L23a n=1 Tax=Cricetulus griseus TaxID=10029 RepID=G3IMD5_CRIGR|nr:60S ribosomal protein L23a [Cricetulus griseus]
MSPTFWWPKTLWLQEAVQITSKECTQEKQACHFATIKFPLATESVMKKIEDKTLVFIVDVKVNKYQIKQAVKKLHDIDVAKVNTLIRPD